MKKKILIVHTAFLGDLLLAIVFFRKLRNLESGAELTLVCRRGVGDFFQRLQLVDEVFEVDKGSSSSYREIRKVLQRQSFDILFCPHRSLRSLFFSLSIPATVRVGYRSALTSLFFSHTVRRKVRWPEPLRVLQLLAALHPNLFGEAGGEELLHTDFYARQPFSAFSDASLASSDGQVSLLPAPPRGWDLSLKDLLPQEAPAECAKGISQLPLPVKRRPRVCLFPGSVWATKRWPARYFAELIGSLLAEDLDIVLLGSRAEAPLNRAILAQVETLGLRNRVGAVFDLTGMTSVYESFLLLTESDLVVANDSASSHLAMTAGVPVLTFFGPTVIEFGYRPWGQKAYLAETARGLKCRPCGPHGHQQCPIKTHECMMSVKPALVFHAVQRILDAAGDRSPRLI